MKTTQKFDVCTTCGRTVYETETEAEEAGGIERRYFDERTEQCHACEQAIRTGQCTVAED